jgi:Acetyltransferase (GNAT) domain
VSSTASKKSDLSISSVQGDAPDGWDREVLEAGGTPFHTLAIGAAAVARGQEAWYLRFEQQGRAVGFAVGAGVRSATPILGRRRSVLEFETMPLLLSDGSRTRVQAVAAIREFASDEGFGQLRLLSRDDRRPEETPALESVGLTVAPRLECRVALAADLETMMTRMSDGHRNSVTNAMSAGFQFFEDTSLEGAMRLQELRETSYGRRQAPGTAATRSQAREELQNVMRAYLAHEAIRFWFVHREGRPMSGAGIMPFGDRAYFAVGGTNQEGYGAGAVYALYGNLLPYLSTQGIRELNLGDIDAGAEAKGHAEHGLYRFRTGFGAEVVRSYTATGTT